MKLGYGVNAALVVAMLRLAGPAAADGAADLQACYGANDRGEYDNAIALCTQAVQSGELSNTDAAMALNDRGDAYNAKGDYDRAIASYDEAVKRRPDYENAFFDRATAYDGKEDAERAIRDYTKAIALSPSDAHAYFSRGDDYSLGGDYTHAVYDYEQAAQLDAELADVASWSKGEALFDLGKFPEAIAAFKRYLAVKPDYSYGALWIYLAQAHAGKDAKPAFAERAKLLDLGQWPGPIVKFFQGAVTRDAVFAAAKQGDPTYLPDQACEAAFYLGEFDLLAGKKDEARRNLTDAASLCSKRSAERGAARSELKRM